MHMMIVGIVLHATVLAVLAFFVLFAASKAEGLVKLLGYILGLWLLLLTIGAIAAGAWHCLHPDADHGMDRAHHGWMTWMHDGSTPPSTAPQAPQTAPAPAAKH